MSDDTLKTKYAIQSLSSVLSSLPPSLSFSKNPAVSLLHDPYFSSQISTLLHEPNSGSGDNNLCRWFYDTFQSGVADLQILVLRFLPTIAGLYLSRVLLRKPLAGFEAVLLALYAHETTSRAGQAITVNIPSMCQPTIYHESKESIKNSNATNLNLAVVSQSLEPHGTVRSTRRARIVGVALEMYYDKILQMPVGSKNEFCNFCKIWAGDDGNMQNFVVKDVKKEVLKIEDVKQEDEKREDMRSEKVHKHRHETSENAQKEDEEDEIFEDVSEEHETMEVEKNQDGDEKCDTKEKEEKDVRKEGRVPLPWVLLRPVLRILGHCMMGTDKDNELLDAAGEACRRLYARSLHDMNPKAILAIGSLIRLSELPKEEVEDPTEIPITDVITL